MFLRRALLILSLFLSLSEAYAGVIIGGTRVIFNEGNSDTSLSIKNSTKKSVFLIQSWIEDSDNKINKSFIITPPLFRLDPQKENVLRIIKATEGLPIDRESLFWLNIKQIPSVDDEETKNSLQLVIKSRLKLIFRPGSIAQQSENGYKKLQFSKESDGVRIKNPTPYYISLHNLLINNVEQKNVDLVPPMGSIVIHNSKLTSPTKINWQSINDFGGITPSESAVL